MLCQSVAHDNIIFVVSVSALIFKTQIKLEFSAFYKTFPCYQNFAAVFNKCFQFFYSFLFQNDAVRKNNGIEFFEIILIYNTKVYLIFQKYLCCTFIAYFVL